MAQAGLVWPRCLARHCLKPFFRRKSMPRWTEKELDGKLEGVDWQFHAGPAQHYSGPNQAASLSQLLHLIRFPWKPFSCGGWGKVPDDWYWWASLTGRPFSTSLRMDEDDDEREVQRTWPYVGILCYSVILMMMMITCDRRERSRGYTPVDDTDPFLPGPPPYINNYGSIGTPSSAILNANGSSSNIQAQGYR